MVTKIGDKVSGKISEGMGADRVLRVGVVGAGVMGTNHGRVMAGLPGIELVGIVDPLPEHRARAAKMIGCPTFADLDQLLAAGIECQFAHCLRRIPY